MELLYLLIYVLIRHLNLCPRMFLIGQIKITKMSGKPS